jgi:hypothetical protein
VSTICETKVIQLAHTLWIQLQDNSWTKYAAYPDTVNVLCGEGDPVNVIIGGIYYITQCCNLTA